ncbi:MAG: hypothetical protein KDB93_13600 [Flavobacteriales bacterium]|nr:hypothetical protein [Flavobacteriales bacterium]
MKPATLFRLFIVLLVLSVVKYLWLAGHVHPVADDFCYAAKARGVGLWSWSRSEWLYWNGRYASNLLVARGPLSWSTDFLPGYRAVPVLLLALTFVSMWFFLRRVTRHVFSTGKELLAALVFFLLYLNLMPDLGEGFYWYTGAITYQLGSILLLIHLGLLFGRPPRGLAGFAMLLLNLLLAVVITGMDEIHMLLMVLFHAGHAIWTFRHGTQRAAGAWMFLAVLAGAALMYLAPGNAVRGAMFADTRQFWRSLGMSALQSGRFSGMWLLSPALLAAAVLYIPLHKPILTAVPNLVRWLRMPAVVALMLPFLLVVATTFPAYWSTGLLGQHRTINVACILFIPAALLNLAIWLERGWLGRLAQFRPTSSQLSFTYLLFISALNLTGNGFAVHADLWSGRAAEYDRVLQEREAQVQAAALDPDAQVHFVRLAKPPRSLPSYEVLGPLRDWMMHCEARYFGAAEDQVEMVQAE